MSFTTCSPGFLALEDLGLILVPSSCDETKTLLKSQPKIWDIGADGGHCNQVNQDGGYTGMTPAGFRRFVEGIADRVGFDRSGLILGGDHLGPNPWKHLPADDAMMRARTMIDAYGRAGFAKLHLDTSMGCLGESIALPDETTAQRAASLAGVAEAAVEPSGPKPVYVIG